MKKIILIAVVFFIVALCRLAYLHLFDSVEDENKALLINMKKKIVDFYDSCGKFPSEENGLNALKNPSLENCTASPMLSIVPEGYRGEKIIYSFNGNKATISFDDESSDVIQIK